METITMDFRVPPVPAKYAEHKLASRAFDVRYSYMLREGHTEEEALEDATRTAEDFLNKE